MVLGDVAFHCPPCEQDLRQVTRSCVPRIACRSGQPHLTGLLHDFQLSGVLPRLSPATATEDKGL